MAFLLYICIVVNAKPIQTNQKPGQENLPENYSELIPRHTSCILRCLPKRRQAIAWQLQRRIIQWMPFSNGKTDPLRCQNIVQCVAVGRLLRHIPWEVIVRCHSFFPYTNV